MTWSQLKKGLGDTDTFEFVNRNPDGRRTTDCSTRVICGALGIGYDEALDLQCEAAKATHYGITDNEVVAKILGDHGWAGFKIGGVAAGERRKTVGDIAKANPNRTVVIRAAGHWTLGRNGMIQDIWDCTRKTAYGVYFKA